MNTAQNKAAVSLKAALEKCNKTGLQGGVFDGNFCLWPKELDPATTGECDSDFFFEVEKYGAIVNSDMPLDGGAGV